MTFETLASDIVSKIEGNPDCRVNKEMVVAQIIREVFSKMVPDGVAEAYGRGRDDGIKFAMSMVGKICKEQTERIISAYQYENQTSKKSTGVDAAVTGNVA